MAEQAGYGEGQGAVPGRGPGLPDSAACAPGRDARLAGFAAGGSWDACPPSAALAGALEAASGTEWRCEGASRDELFGLLRQWQALESRAAAGKLAVLRALIREDDQPLPGGGYHGDLPAGWTKSLTHEVALGLSMPAVSADRLMWLAWDLEARLPGTGALLAAGQLTTAKATAVDEALQQLSSEDAAAAEALILDGLPGKTYGQVVKLAVQAAVTVDPDSAARRRQEAERHRCRVEMFREQSGAAGLAGRELPTDQTLGATASVSARAQEYEESGVFPDGTRMDQYRVAAFLDLLNGVTAAGRIATGLLPGDCPTGEEPAGAGGPAAGGAGCACRECDGSCLPPDDDDGCADDSGDDDRDPDAGAPGDGDPEGGAHRDRNLEGEAPGDRNPEGGVPGGREPDCDGPHGGNPDAGGPSEGKPDGGRPSSGNPDNEERGTAEPGRGSPSGGNRDSGVPGRGVPDDERRRGGAENGVPGRGEPAAERRGTPAVGPARLADLVLPLATLLGLAERPGDGYRLGPLDPDLCRELALAAAGSPASRLCVTVTDPDGIAIGHGCARVVRRGKRPVDTEPFRHGPARGAAVLPARVNLTVTAARLAQVAELREPADPAGPPDRALWGFTRDTGAGPPGGYGTWTLTQPDGRSLAVELGPVPTFDCDHQHESHAYQPNDTLRHLVQIRDGECTFPPCSRHARESDFEHATPYDKGGRTCACNAGARSRACHQVKQSPHWHVSQPKPGWHQWETPSGRVYVQGPKRYPV